MQKLPEIITCFLIYLLAVSVCTASDVKCIVLLHGLARSHHAMSSIESTLKQQGYIVVNQNYPSTKKSITALANQDIQPMVDACLIHHPTQVMFVTHSLGGMVLQTYLKNHTVPNLSHIVMLSPPNHGSPLADLLHNNWFFQKIMGPAGQELTTSHFDSVVPAKAGIHFLAQHHVNLTMDPRLRLSLDHILIESWAIINPSTRSANRNQPSQRVDQAALPVFLESFQPPSLAIAL